MQILSFYLYFVIVNPYIFLISVNLEPFCLIIAKPLHFSCKMFGYVVINPYLCIRNKKIGIEILKAFSMSTTVKNNLRQIMTQAWQMVKRNGFSMSEALKCAWRNAKLRSKMSTGIVKFYFQKIDGTIREAFGTLASNLIPATQSTSNRKRNDTVQTYYDSEKCDWRCFKIANLIRLA